MWVGILDQSKDNILSFVPGSILNVYQHPCQREHLLLTGGFPLLALPLQFANWADAVIFVFSLENEASFQELSQYYGLLTTYRAVSDMALALVGTQGE